MRAIILLYVFLFSGTAILMGQPTAKQNSPWKKNLLINGDAESYPEGKFISGWQADTSIVQQPVYTKVKGSIIADTSKFLNMGKQYFRFAGKSDSTERVIYQEIDLREYADSILKNNIQFYLAGFFGGKDSLQGTVTATVCFYESHGLKLGTWSTKPVLPKDRSYTTLYIRREVRDTIPPQAVKAVVELKGYRGSSCKQNPTPACPWEAYAENISLLIVPAFNAKVKPAPPGQSAPKQPQQPTQKGKP